jgi:hypothetical protein
MRMLCTLVLALIVAAGGAAAWAHDDHGHDDTHAAKHGGVFVDNGHHHYEVVAKDGEIVVYLTHEDGTAQNAAGAKAAAAILTDGKKVDVDLVPDGETLKGAGAFKAGKDTVIVLTVTMPEHEPEQVRVELE